MSRKQLLISIVLAALLISSCSPTTATPAEMPTTEGPYPYPSSVTQTIPTPPYPLVGPPTPDIVYMVPTPSANGGVVLGQLVDINTGEPLSYRHIYLGFKIYMTPGPDYTLGIDPTSSPTTTTDKDGRFAIGNIPPGKYVIFVWTPVHSSTAVDASGSTELEITVEAGETLDLGTVKAPDPM